MENMPSYQDLKEEFDEEYIYNDSDYTAYEVFLEESIKQADQVFLFTTGNIKYRYLALGALKGLIKALYNLKISSFFKQFRELPSYYQEEDKLVLEELKQLSKQHRKYTKGDFGFKFQENLDRLPETMKKATSINFLQTIEVIGNNFYFKTHPVDHAAGTRVIADKEGEKQIQTINQRLKHYDTKISKKQ